MTSRTIERVLKALESLSLATSWCIYRSLRDDGFPVDKEHLDYTIRKLFDEGKVDVVSVPLGLRHYNLYCPKGSMKEAKEIIAKVKMKIKERLENDFIQTRFNVLKQIDDTTYGVKKYVFRHMIAMGELDEFRVQKGDIGSYWVFFLPTVRDKIEEMLRKIREEMEKKKFISLKTLSKETNTEDRIAWWLAKHLVFRGELNYTRCKETDAVKQWTERMVFYIPGYETQAFTLIYQKRINEVVGRLELPEEVRDKAVDYFLKCYQAGYAKGRSIENLIAPAIYLATKSCNVPIFCEQISELTDMDKNAMLSLSRILAPEIGLPSRILISHPEDFVEIIVDNLSLDEAERCSLIDESKNILKSIPRSFFFGRSRATVAAATVYLASGRLKFGVTQGEIASLARITEVSLRNNKKAILKILRREKNVL